MDIHPILSTLKRHKTVSLLIVIEIALSCSILCNALFLVHTRLELMNRVTGLDESEVIRLQVANSSTDDQAPAISEEGLAKLRAIPGVRAAAVANSIPLGMTGRSLDVKLRPEQPALLEASYYMGGVGLLEAMGLNLVAGRNFAADEMIDWKALDAPNSKLSVPVVIITRGMADRIFHGENPVGRSIYAWNEEPSTIVGVVDHLAQPHGHNDPASYDFSVLLPVKGAFSNYIVRVANPSLRADVLKQATKELKRIAPGRLILKQQTVEEMRDSYYRLDIEMAWLLVVVCVALLVVTAFGIVGLASFWVQQRSTQIGVRRALGATRNHILRYFQLENFLLATFGILLGVVLAYVVNQLLMAKYELQRLPFAYLPIGAVTLWMLGQIAVWGPARRAAAIPPAIAIRSA